VLQTREAYRPLFKNATRESESAAFTLAGNLIQLLPSINIARLTALSF